MAKPIQKLAMVLCAIFLLATNGASQERRKLRITNAGFTITALPLLAAKEWGIFNANNLDMEVILMQSALGPSPSVSTIKPASAASVNLIMTATSHLVPRTHIYWLMANPQFKPSNLKGKNRTGANTDMSFEHGAGSRPIGAVLVSITQ
jgi:hypothetical protein